MQFKMMKARHCHHHYSAEEIMNAVMASSDSEQLNTDSDDSDISEVESLQETFKTSLPDGPKLQKKDKSKKIAVSPITSPNLQKVYVELQNVMSAMSSKSDIPTSSLHPVYLEFSTDPHFHCHLIPVVTLLIQVQRATKVLPHFPLIRVL